MADGSYGRDFLGLRKCWAATFVSMEFAYDDSSLHGGDTSRILHRSGRWPIPAIAATWIRYYLKEGVSQTLVLSLKCTEWCRIWKVQNERERELSQS